MKRAHPQEPDRISAKRIVWIGALSLIVGVTGVGISRALDLPRGDGATSTAPATIGMLEQRAIESTERGIALRNKQEASLHAYRWCDRDAGIAEIPIERAMQIAEERAR